MLAITETWIKTWITDEQISIANYTRYRMDRENRSRGGVLIYIHYNYPVINYRSFDNNYCELVLCTLPTLKLIVANLYCPCECPDGLFDDALKFI